jgi:hypothetical protein
MNNLLPILLIKMSMMLCYAKVVMIIIIVKILQVSMNVVINFVKIAFKIIYQQIFWKEKLCKLIVCNLIAIKNLKRKILKFLEAMTYIKSI